MATLQVYNPNASPVAVTGIQLQFFDSLNNPIQASANLPMLAMGPGQTVVAPARSSINFGPFPIVIGSAANIGSPTIPLTTPPTSVNIELAEPQSAQLYLGATVYGSDGSINTAGRAAVFVSPTIGPIPLMSGGVLQFYNGSNLLIGIMTGVL